MKNIRRTAYWIVIATAAACFILLSTVACFIDLRLGLVGLGLAVVLILFVLFDLFSMRSLIKKLLVVNAGADSTLRTAVSGFGVPAAAIGASGEIIWYNDLFRTAFLHKEALLEPAATVLPELDTEKVHNGAILELSHAQRHFSVLCSDSASAAGVCFALFFEDTENHNTAVEFKKTRPCVMLFSLDNYEDVMSGARDSDKSAIISSADRVIEDFINSTNGIMRKISTTGYIAIIEEQHMKQIIEHRFPVLDAMRKIETGGISLTLSIGAGHGARTLYENQIFAKQALDMAMGRGGDQAGVKYNKEFTFFGGAGKEIEKQTRIRARTIASALANIISESSNVLVMGHRMSDLDSVGSSVGIARAATTLGVPVNIVIDEKTTMALSLVHLMKQNGYARIFISSAEARQLITPATLLVIVDTQIESRVDAPELVPLIKNLVVIDHHRMTVGRITRSVLFYHDPHASSCAELITELLQYITSDSAKATRYEALALLSGIMLDTKFFTLRTGARTFEASAQLKRLGAEPMEAKKLFASGFDIYKAKAALVSSAVIYRGCAIAFAGKLEGELRLAVPQAADELLNIEGVRCSIVGFEENGVIYLSARSLGAYNVQLIMENIGGGGHQTMAGVQLKDCTVADARDLVRGAIDRYLETNSTEEQK